MPLAALFTIYPIVLGAAFTLPCCALRGTSGAAIMPIPGGAGTPYVTVN